MATGGPCATVDHEIALWFRHNLTPAFVDLLWALTTPGSALFISSVLGLCVLAFAWKKYWLGLITLIATVGGGSLLGETLKLIFQRQRPFLAGPWGVWGGYSFPSGHTIAATLLYGFLGLALLKLCKRRRWRFLWASTALLLILGVGFSRIALGAHYLTDVLAAMTIGSLWIFLCPVVIKSCHRAVKPAPAILAQDQPIHSPPSECLNAAAA